MHTIYPMLISKDRRHFYFTCDTTAVLDRPETDIICITRIKKRAEKSPQGFLIFLEQLKQRYATVVCIDNSASAGYIHPAALEKCDWYFKRSVYTDRNQYKRPLESGRSYVQYYVDTGQVDGGGWTTGLAENAPLDKLEVLWNIGLGSYPRSRYRKAVALRLASAGLHGVLPRVYAYPRARLAAKEKDTYISARFAVRFQNHGVQHHRTIFQHAAENDTSFRTGVVTLKEYNRELETATAVLSPFGYGEECLRDFEAIYNGAVLIKPDMDHIETWPNVYEKNKTYAPCNWDATDVAEVGSFILDNPHFASELANSAMEVMQSAQEAIDSRVEWFIEMIC
ncbi:hypothetical protein [Spirochaeta africana]|nr:hypothetical protein [Spirochaeta africana]